MEENPSTESLISLAEQRAEFDLVYLDPGERLDVFRRQFVGGPRTLDRCLPIHEVMADNSYIVVPTRIGDISVVVNEVLPRCGFSRVIRVFALRAPGTADLRSVPVLVIAKRGVGRSAISDLVWAYPPANAELLEIVEGLFPNAQRRLIAFARGARRGWTALIGNATWVEMPE